MKTWPELRRLSAYQVLGQGAMGTAIDAAGDAVESQMNTVDPDGVQGAILDTAGKAAVVIGVTEAAKGIAEQATGKDGGDEGAGGTRGADGKTFQTYTKEGPNGEVYTGRTSGPGTPAENVASRDRGHHMNDKGYGPAQLDKSSSNPDAIRGREQQVIEASGGAQSQGGSSGNAINGILSEQSQTRQIS